MTGAVWALEWRAALARRRLFAWNVGVPLLLLAPVAWSPAAAPHRATVFAVLFVLFGAFGGCVPLVREGEEGWTEKVLLTGVGEARWLAERTAAAVFLDVLQLLPAATLVVAAGGGRTAVPLLAGLALALLAANLLGVAAAAAVRSLAEGALACAALALAALHLTGVFRTPEPGTWQAWARMLSPFRPLHATLAANFGAGTEPATGWAGAAATVALLGTAALLFAGPLARRLSGRARV